MKNLIITFFHYVLGYNTYIKLFTIFKIQFLNWDSRKSDFLYFTNLIGERGNVIVIGANTGITTIPFARNHPKRNVLAYEPLKSNFDCLNSIVKYYKCHNVSTLNIGLGNKIGKEDMILPKQGGARKHGMAYVSSVNENHKLKGDKYEINISRIDDERALNDIEVNAIKIVAENSEFEIFSGGINLLQKWKPIIYCELWGNENRTNTLELIESIGYSVYFIKEGELHLFNPNLYTGKNFVFKHNG